jgi:2-isopropylmalate synthase
MKKKLRMTEDQVKQEAAAGVARAKGYCDDVEFSPEDGSRSDADFMCEVCQIAVDNGATTINIPDTVGFGVPEEFAELIKFVLARVRGDYVVSTHCHNDLGLAVANSLAAIEAGARQVECTINGIGERAGNACLEEIVMALHVRADRLPFETGIKTQELYPTSQLLSSIVGFEVQPNKAIVGRNAFAHEAGIHQHGVINNPLCYEIMTPESVGVPANSLVLGKHSGRHALSLRYTELGYDITAAELDAAYKSFTNLADRKKRIYDQDLISLLSSAARARSEKMVGAAA